VVVNFVIEPENRKPRIGNQEPSTLSNTNNAARSFSYTVTILGYYEVENKINFLRTMINILKKLVKIYFLNIIN